MGVFPFFRGLDDRGVLVGGSVIFCLLDRRPEGVFCDAVVADLSFTNEVFRFRLVGVEEGAVGTSVAAEAGARVAAGVEVVVRTAWLAA